MSVVDVLRALNVLASAQWGLVTTAQAGRHRVSRLQLSRLVEDGLLERVTQGVYRASGVPADRHEALKAVWLSIDPALTAEERLRRHGTDAIVSGPTAAHLLGIGDLLPEPYEFTAPTRRQTQRHELRYRTRQLPPDSVTVREGLPVTTIEQTIADLVEAHTDRTLVAGALGEAGERLDRARLAELLTPLAARNGFTSGDALLDDLERLTAATSRRN